MNDPLLTLVARAVLDMEMKMAELAGLREAVSRIAGCIADLQAAAASASPAAIDAAVATAVAAALADRDATDLQNAADRAAAIEADKADAVNAALAQHDEVVQQQIDGITADINAILPA